MTHEGILLGRPDYRKLSGIVSAWKNNRRPLDHAMRTIEADLRTARVVDEEELPDDTVSIGSRATVRDLDSGETLSVRLVFPAELDGSGETASIFSPLGSAVLGEKVGTEVDCEAPTGRRRFRLMAVCRA